MRVRAIDFIVSSVSDLEKAKAFYRDVLGIGAGLLVESEFRAEFDTQPVALGLARWDQQPATAIGLAVDDVRAAVEELRAQGVTILREPFDTPFCTSAFIADPDGNPICLHQRKDGTAG